MHRSILVVLFHLLFTVLGFAQESAPVGYDPTKVSTSHSSVERMELRDEKRDRVVPIKLYIPKEQKPYPVVLFSHGLGGSREACGYLGDHWSQHGYLVIVLQHPGSDEAVWKDVPLRRRMRSMQAAASAKNAELRIRDVSFVIDQLERWSLDSEHPLASYLDLEHIGMSGHSFGAQTTQWVSGQRLANFRQTSIEARIDAALMLSPNIPQRGDVSQAFASVEIPWMLMTGTRDASPIGDTDPKDRREVFAHLPKTIERYELVLEGAEHSAFSDGGFGLRKQNPNHHSAIAAISLAFWDTHLKELPEARDWLRGEGPRLVLESADVWQCPVVD